MIKMQVIGHLGKDCVVNTVNGKNVINFSVAHTEKFKDAQGGLTEKTTWVECSYWTDKTAVATYLVKGKLVFAEGSVEARSFQRNDGTPGASLNMRVREVQLLSSGNTATGSGSPAYAGSSGSTAQSNNGNAGSSVDAGEPVDDLPF